jgi:hypothetical protein
VPFTLTPDSCILFLPPTNYHSFQLHSRLKRITTFVFYNIAALPWVAESRSFVFTDIRALFPQFLKLLRFFFTCRR